MSSGELQDWSWATSGCARRSFLVRFLYLSKALLMISLKLEGGDSRLRVRHERRGNGLFVQERMMRDSQATG